MSEWGYWVVDTGGSRWIYGSDEAQARSLREEACKVYPVHKRGPVQFGKDPNPFETKPEPNIVVGTPAQRISAECDAIKAMLLEKNKRYGNSALEPQRIASRAPAEEQILVRIDDKLSRWKTSAPGDDEDIVKDLIGYLIMLRVARQK